MDTGLGEGFGYSMFNWDYKKTEDCLLFNNQPCVHDIMEIIGGVKATAPLLQNDELLLLS